MVCTRSRWPGFVARASPHVAKWRVNVRPAADRSPPELSVCRSPWSERPRPMTALAWTDLQLDGANSHEHLQGDVDGVGRQIGLGSDARSTDGRHVEDRLDEIDRVT